MGDKTLIIGDLHIGVKNNSEIMMNYMKNFFQNELFPYIKENNIKRVIQLGDTLDKRKTIDFVTSTFLIKEWLSWFDENDVELYSIIGNHDTYYKNTNEISGIKQYESLFKNVHIIDHPMLVRTDMADFHLIPWICPENKEEILTYISKIELDTKDHRTLFMCGHFELAGFYINKNFVSKSGSIDRAILEDSPAWVIFSGHYHTPSENKNIVYVGTPYQLTWNDYGDEKRFFVIDEASTPIEVLTHQQLFYKIVYTPGMSVSDVTLPHHAFVKLLVSETDSLLDVFVNELTEKYCLSQCQVIDISEHSEEMEQELETLELDDPFHIMMKSIESIEDPFISTELLSIYKEAQTLERN